MNAERTLVLIKPDAIAHEQDAVYRITQAGFHIINKERIRLTDEQIAEAFSQSAGSSMDAVMELYKSGPILVMILEKQNAINEAKSLLGHIDPVRAKEASPNSLRAKYGSDSVRNGFHCSDNKDVAEKEIRIFFPNVYVDPIPEPDCNKNFLNNEVYPVLTQGLTQLCKQKPANPVEFLGTWLLENNPNVPKVTI